MEFKSLHEDTTCDCTINAEEDNENLYVRRIRRPTITEKDLESHWERGQRPKPSDSGNCEKICGLKGLSVNIWNESSMESTIQKYIQIFRITPKHQDGLYVFRFRENAGLLKHSPEHDVYHYDFYKSDFFTGEMLEEKEVISINSFL